jgi:hypothetical protein
MEGCGMTIANITNGEAGLTVRNKLNAAIDEVNGLGTAATTDASDYATAAQGQLADTAVQPGDLATVATTGAYGNLSGTPDLSAYIESDPSGITGADAVTNIISLTQAEYNAIGTPDAATLYVVI